jgi:hypothetical protein
LAANPFPKWRGEFSGMYEVQHAEDMTSVCIGAVTGLYLELISIVIKVRLYKLHMLFKTPWIKGRK